MPDEPELPADRIELARKFLAKGFHLQKVKMRGKDYARMRKYGDRDMLLGPWGPDFDKLREELPPPRVGRPRVMAPEARADQTVDAEIGAKMSNEAKRITRDTFNVGWNTRSLERAAETFGYKNVGDYVNMLHRRYIGEQIAGRRPRDSWSRFKDTAYACMLAQAAGVNVNPNLIPTMFLIEKLGGGA